MTHFDEFYDEDDDEDTLSEKKIKDHICDLAAQGKTQLARENVVSVCGQWARIARQLQYRPDDEELATKARRALKMYGSSIKALAEASSKVLSEILLNASQIAGVEAR